MGADVGPLVLQAQVGGEGTGCPWIELEIRVEKDAQREPLYGLRPTVFQAIVTTLHLEAYSFPVAMHRPARVSSWLCGSVLLLVPGGQRQDGKAGKAFGGLCRGACLHGRGGVRGSSMRGGPASDHGAGVSKREVVGHAACRWSEGSKKW